MFFFTRMSKKYIQKQLSNSDYTIEVKKCVTSTNTIMKEKARKAAKEFSVLIASQQTAGRGRMGRSFHSPRGTGIYMSILTKMPENSNPLLITTDAAVCCARVFERMTGERAEIKWVNDIYMGEKKVCGILTEGAGGYAIVGIGINVIPPKEGFPDNIKSRAGAVFEKNKPHLREDIIVQFLQEFIKIHKNTNREVLLKEYRDRSIITGKEIFILKNDGQEKATAIGIADDYSLIVKKENGEKCNLNSGDVSIKI